MEKINIRQIGVVCYGNIARSQILGIYINKFLKEAYINNIRVYSIGTAEYEAYPDTPIRIKEVKYKLKGRGVNVKPIRNFWTEEGQEQLETSDDSRIWARPIPYRNNPEAGFTYKLRLREEELEYGPLEDGFFRPDRSEPETILELLEKVNPPKTKRKKLTIKPGDKITVYLHGAGVVSQEKETVAKVGKKYLFIERENEGPNKFDMATGKCVNDIDPRYSCGFYRTIEKLL